MSIDPRTGREESPGKLHPVAEGIVGHIQSQLKAGYVVVDDLPDILDSVMQHVRDVYRPRERSQEQQ